MEWTVISLGLSYLGVSIAFMGLMSRMFRNQFARVEDKIDNLARDHQSLARELSEFRGEMRGRLDDRSSIMD